MKDIQGIDRGRCNKCHDCAEYTTGDGRAVRCLCGHTPSDHETTGTQPDAQTTAQRAPPRQRANEPCRPPRAAFTGRGLAPRDGVTALCPFPGCNQPVEFDLNTGRQEEACQHHRHTSSFVPNYMCFPDFSAVAPTRPPLAQQGQRECVRGHVIMAFIGGMHGACS